MGYECFQWSGVAGLDLCAHRESRLLGGRRDKLLKALATV